MTTEQPTQLQATEQPVEKTVRYQRDELGYCNCAGCGKVLLGEKSEQRLLTAIVIEALDFPNPVAREATLRAGYAPSVRGRIEGRPYCDNCLRVRINREQDGHDYPTHDDPEDD
jgi:hypothetical protein